MLVDPVQEGYSLHFRCSCFGHILPDVGQLVLQFRAEDNLLVNVGNIVLMVFWITVTVPFDNLSEERIYICLVSITLAFLTLFIIVLVAAASITTASTIYLLPAPLDFSKLDFFADITVLLFITPATSLS